MSGHVHHPRVALLAAVLAAAVACGGPPRGGARPRDDVGPGAPVALFIGSSTVLGSGASTRERRWTTLLCRAAGWREVNAGLSGSLLTDVESGPPIAAGERRFGALPRQPRPSVVFVMYGANDVRHRVPLGDVGVAGTFRNAATKVLGGLRDAYPDARLVVVTPQPARSLLERRTAYDEALVAAARASGAVVVRGEAAFPPEALDRLGADAIHLNDAGHAALAAHVAHALAAERVLAAR